MRVQDNIGRTNGKIGFTLTCQLQTKYKEKMSNIPSKSCTIHTTKSPEEVIELIKELLGGLA